MRAFARTTRFLPRRSATFVASSALAAVAAAAHGRAELLHWLSAHGERADEQMRAGLLRGADASQLVPALMHALLDRAKDTRNAAEATLRLVVVSGAAPRSRCPARCVTSRRPYSDRSKSPSRASTALRKRRRAPLGRRASRRTASLA